ncbi:MAG TPA: phosphotransferase [Caulobacteraceae bacterium]|nr:phosphotransferase [Caulobacteraceae bacterium]
MDDASAARALFPARLEAVTPQWLSAVLGASVADFVAEPVGDGAGFMGVVTRLRMDYRAAGTPGPRSVILKLPSGHAGARMQAGAFGHYAKEVAFYRNLAARAPVRTAKPLFCGFDAAGMRFCLILEDLAPARTGDQLGGLSRDEMAASVEAAAVLHGRWLGAVELQTFPWLPGLDDPTQLALAEILPRCLPRYLEFTGGSAEAAAVAGCLGPRIALLLRVLARRRRTLVHGDLRGDNLLFDGLAGPVAFIDWQLVHKGTGLTDLAFLFTSSLATDDRRALEGELMSLYLDTLKATGAAMETRAAWRDYALSLALCWVWTVIGIGSLEVGKGRGAQVFAAWNTRLLAALADHETARVVETETA